jgi:hypothetical protein
LNVFNSVDIADAHPSNLYFILEDVPIYDIEDIPAGYFDGTLSGPIHKNYFLSNTDVTQAYWDRLWMPPHQIQLFGNPELTKEVRLLVNWK